MKNTGTKTLFSAKITKPPRKQTNTRTRNYLVTHEIMRLMDAAKSQGRHRQRDQTLILLMFRHALRVGEIIALRWEQVDLKQA